jgi:hypothetical protein
MIVERIHSGVLFSPEVKGTRFDGDIKPLIGGSIGYVAEETFFFGGGGYWLPEYGHSDHELGYGGFVMQWFVANSDRFGVSGKVLLGGGTATTTQLVTQVVYPNPEPTPRPGNGPQVPVQPVPVTSQVHVHQDFVVAEPEADVRIALAKSVRLAIGVGYRFAGDGWWHPYYGYNSHLNDRVSGATVTFGVHIGM